MKFNRFGRTFFMCKVFYIIYIILIIYICNSLNNNAYLVLGSPAAILLAFILAVDEKVYVSSDGIRYRTGKNGEFYCKWCNVLLLREVHRYSTRSIEVVLKSEVAQDAYSRQERFYFEFTPVSKRVVSRYCIAPIQKSSLFERFKKRGCSGSK